MVSKFNLAALPALSALIFVVPGAQAALILNPSFTLSTPGQLNGTDANWTSGGANYNWIFASGTADTTGAPGGLMLWGPNNGSSNGLPASSPDGGNFVAADGCAFQNTCLQPSTISQVLMNLTPNASYDVGFWYGFAQQAFFNGPTIQSWNVCLGANCQSTASFNLPSHGFSGWIHKDFIFQAQTSNDTLSFLAFGDMPVPPFAVLDGITVSAAPEPSTLAILGIGLLGLIVVGLRRRVGAF